MSASTPVVDLSTMLLPVAGKLLVVPSVVVAEIIKRRELVSEPRGPHWMLGRLHWRRELIPVISFEAVNDAQIPEERGGSRLVIMSVLSDQPSARHYAILTQGVPHLLRLLAGDISERPNAVLGPAERMGVSVHGQVAAIPDLDLLERRLLELA